MSRPAQAREPQLAGVERDMTGYPIKWRSTGWTTFVIGASRQCVICRPLSTHSGIEAGPGSVDWPGSSSPLYPGQR